MPTSPVFCSNYKSATNPAIKDKVESQIRVEITNGRYKVVNEPARITSSLGAIPKGNNKIRLIHDCSRPIGQALNDFASTNHFSYTQIQDAVNLIKPGSYLAKVDLESAYRSVPISQESQKYTGLHWKFKGENLSTYMVDTRLPFGARRSPEIFNKLTQAVCRIMKSQGFSPVLAYLDDFLIIADDKKSCQETLQGLLQLLRHLGFAINYNKLVQPSQRLTFLGIVLDTVNGTLELPSQKINELWTMLSKLYAKKKCTKRYLQSVTGKLSWATQVIYGGRFHLRRLYDQIQRLHAPHHHTRVTAEMKLDVEWWLKFMKFFNGLTPMVDCRPSTPVWLDACNVAAGAVYGNEFVYTPFSEWPGSEKLHINFKETLTLETAVRRWAPLWSNAQIIVYSDNQAAVGIINRGSSDNPFVMESLRRIWFYSATYNFRIKAYYLPGHCNTVADAISRLHDPAVMKKLNCNALIYD